MPSGIADYSSEIVPYLAARSDVDVFCPRPGMFSRARVPRGATLRDPKQYPELIERPEEVRLVDDQLLGERLHLLGTPRVVAKEVVVIEERVETGLLGAGRDLLCQKLALGQRVVQPDSLFDDRTERSNVLLQMAMSAVKDDPQTAARLAISTC